MIVCEKISKIGLMLFWKCMTKEEQAKFIEEERVGKLKRQNIQNIVRNSEEKENRHSKAVRAVSLLNEDIQNGLSFEETKKLLIELEDYLRCMT